MPILRSYYPSFPMVIEIRMLREGVQSLLSCKYSGTSMCLHWEHETSISWAIPGRKTFGVKRCSTDVWMLSNDTEVWIESAEWTICHYDKSWSRSLESVHISIRTHPPSFNLVLFPSIARMLTMRRLLSLSESSWQRLSKRWTPVPGIICTFHWCSMVKMMFRFHSSWMMSTIIWPTTLLHSIA